MAHEIPLCGKRKKLSFGAYPEVTLQKARLLRDDARVAIAAGYDPARQRKAAKLAATLSAATTFGAVGREFIEKKEKDGLAATTIGKSRWLLSLLEPSLGNVPVAEVSSPELLAVLVRVQDSDRRETARRLRSLASRVFDYAIATGRAEQNPAVALRGALIAPTVQHHAAITDRQHLGQLLRAIESYQGYPSTCAALKLYPHVFQRPGEIRNVKWIAVDLVAGQSMNVTQKCGADTMWLFQAKPSRSSAQCSKCPATVSSFSQRFIPRGGPCPKTR